MANDARLNILIEAKNKASAELRKVQADVKGLGGSASVLAGLAKGFAGIGGAVAAINASKVAFELGQVGASLERLRDSFDVITQSAGQSSDEILAAMRRASRGTISDSALMLQANRASLLGVADTAEELSQLLELAINRGRALGVNAEQAFTDIVLGIGRLSPLILDNLGIVVDAENTFRNYAQTIGKEANQLTDTERKQALLNATIEKSKALLGENAGLSADAATSFERMDASLQNAKDALGALFTPAAAVVAEKLADAVDGTTAALLGLGDALDVTPLEEQLRGSAISVQTLTGELGGLAIVLAQLQDSGTSLNQVMLGEWLYRMPQEIVGNREAMTQWVIAQIDARGAALDLAQATQTATQALIDSRGQVDSTVVAYNHWKDSSQEAADAQERVAQAAADLASQQAYLRGEIMGTVATMRELVGVADSARGSLRASFLGIADTIGGAAALDGYRKASQQLDIMLNLADKLGQDGDEFAFSIESWAQGIRDSNSELQKTADNVGKIPQSVKDAQSAFDSLKGKISGLLSGALQSGINLDDILGRQDAIEEPARRLADIAVNGFKSPWTKYFQEQFPQLYEQLATSGDPRGAAARILREFEAGLRPELLDRDTAKERVRQLLLGESNIEGLAASIAQELAGEFGGQFSQQDILAKAQQALGAGSGVDISTGLQVAPGAASNLLGQVEAQFASDTAINKAKAIGASVARSLFNGYDEAAGGLPWWDRLLAIILRQQVEAGAN